MGRSDLVTERDGQLHIDFDGSGGVIPNSTYVVGGSEAFQGAWLEPGQRINVSLIVKAGDYDPSENNDLSGEIRVRAGSHDEFGPN